MTDEAKIDLLHGNEQFTSYINTVLERVSKYGIDLTGCRPDHIGVRITWGEKGERDYSKYIEAKRYLQSIGAVMISEAIIPMDETGRPIAIFELPKALSTNGGEVAYLEVPAPRVGKDFGDDFIDHIEIVLPDGMSLEDFVIKNMQLFRKHNLASEDAIMASIIAEQEGKNNPDMTLDLGDGLKVKFHTHDIGYVVREEQSSLTVLDKLAYNFDVSKPGVMG